MIAKRVVLASKITLSLFSNGWLVLATIGKKWHKYGKIGQNMTSIGENFARIWQVLASVWLELAKTLQVLANIWLE